jgi:hypothetical protein
VSAITRIPWGLLVPSAALVTLAYAADVDAPPEPATNSAYTWTSLHRHGGEDYDDRVVQSLRPFARAAIWLAINLAFFFAVQLPVSRWYVQRFRFGPAEWVWRSLTYGRLQPMRLSAKVTAPDIPATAELSS